MTVMSITSRLALATALGTAAIVAQAAPATYTIEPTHTFVTFEAKHFGVSTNRGRFDKTSGSIVFDKAARTGKVDVTIEMGSINTGTGPFDGHLKSKDFFNVEAHPTATFKGDQFKFDGDKVTEVTGTLTLLGKSQPATLKASSFGCYQHPRFKREVCGGDFETTIQRSAFGMDYGIAYGIAYGIPDNVRLVIQVEAVQN